MVASRGLILALSRVVASFCNNNLPIKMLVLPFVLIIGVMEGYLYFVMAFSLLVELPTLRLRKMVRVRPVHLRESPLK